MRRITQVNEEQLTQVIKGVKEIEKWGKKEFKKIEVEFKEIEKAFKIHNHKIKENYWLIKDLEKGLEKLEKKVRGKK